MGKFRADKVDKNSESYKIFKRERKKKRALKSARLILRNLSFKCNEDDVKNHFSQFGNILEVQLLKKDDKFIGCGFVQFEKKNCAAKAIIKANGSKFMGRPVIVDWAVAKDKFYKIKSDPKKEGDVEIKEEVLSDDGTDASRLNSKEKELKENGDNDSESNSDMEVGETMEEGFDENDDDSEEEDDDDDDEEEEDEDDDEEEDEDDDEEEDDDNKFGTEDEDTKPKIKIKSEPLDKPRKPRVTVADESHTVFVKNVPFSVTGDDLKEYAEEFGPVNYALVCMDSLTEHSKGTGFIQFKNAEIAKKVIDGEIKLRIRGTSLIALKPMSKEEIQTSQTKTKDPKDKRNLYLVKEGVILAGSPAAVGISNGDMAKRLQLDNWKSQTLRNLHMFVSPTRLVIHNLPLSYNDTQLRKLFLNNSPKGSVITEARVMKNMKEYKTTGEPKSNGYGFVSFRRHEDALEALRKLNNNPSIFQPNRRPIVAFSIENKRALKVKERRLLNSKLNIPNKNEEPHVKTENKTPKSGKQNRKKNKTKNDPKIPKPLTSTSSDEKPKTLKKPMKPLKVKKTSHDPDEDKPSYAGISARYGTKKLRSKKELINQQMKHFQETKKLKRAKKLSRKQKRSVRQRNVNK